MSGLLRDARNDDQRNAQPTYVIARSIATKQPSFFKWGKLRFIFYITLGALFPCPTFADIQIENPWIRAASGPNAALFMTLVNTSDKPEKLKGAQVDVCAHTELHTHVEEKGVFRMREISTIEIPPSGQANLKPGGHHVMLMKIHRPLKEGDEIPVTLSFEGGESIRCVASVKGFSEECCHKE